MESDKIISSAIEAFDRCEFKDGDMISHDWIKWALKIKTPSSIEEVQELQFLLLSRMDDFRDRLLMERKIALRNIRGNGYMVVPPSDQAYYAAEEGLKHIRKGLQKAELLLENARVDQMTAEERKRHVDTQCRFDSLRGIMTRKRRDVFSLFKPEE